MKLDIEHFGDIMSVFYKARANAAGPAPFLDAVEWAEENAPGYAKMGNVFWFKHEHEAVLFTLRFG